VVKKKYMVMRSGVLEINDGEINVSIHENTYGDQWFKSQEQFDKQVESGLIVEIESLPTD